MDYGHDPVLRQEKIIIRLDPKSHVGNLQQPDITILPREKQQRHNFPDLLKDNFVESRASIKLELLSYITFYFDEFTKISSKTELFCFKLNLLIFFERHFQTNAVLHARFKSYHITFTKSCVVAILR